MFSDVWGETICCMLLVHYCSLNTCSNAYMLAGLGTGFSFLRMQHGTAGGPGPVPEPL